MGRNSWSIGHLEDLSSPLANAGGVVKTVEEVKKIAPTGTGWIELGTITSEKRLGGAYDPENGQPIEDPETGELIKTYHNNPETGETFNAIKLQNPGMDVTYKEIPEMILIADSFNKKLIVNVGAISSDPVVEAIDLVRRAFNAGATGKYGGVLLNAGCPTITVEQGNPYEILSTNLEKLSRVLRALKPVTEKFYPIFIRPSPPKSIHEAEALFKVIRESEAVSAVFIPNSWPIKGPLDETGKPIIGVDGNIVGKSGPAMAAQVLRQVSWAKHFLRGSDIDVVASGGIMDNEKLEIKAARQLKLSLAMGAAATCGTTFFYENPDWREATDKLLREFSEYK